MDISPSSPCLGRLDSNSLDSSNPDSNSLGSNSPDFSHQIMSSALWFQCQVRNSFPIINPRDLVSSHSRTRDSVFSLNRIKILVSRPLNSLNRMVHSDFRSTKVECKCKWVTSDSNSPLVLDDDSFIRAQINLCISFLNY